MDYSDPGSKAEVDTFLAGAAGNIDADTASDRWLVDQNRQFTVLQNDVLIP